MTEVGLSLLASSLSYWASKGPSGCPHIFVASHFHAISKLLPDDCDVLSYHTLEVLRRGAELDFQFRLVEGLVDSSFAAYVAAKMGVPSEVVNRANQIYEHVRSGHTISEITIDYEGEQANRRLYQSFMEILNEFETWDLDSDPYGFLELAEKALYEPTCSNEHTSDRTKAQESEDQSQHSDGDAAEEISSSTDHHDNHISSQQCVDKNSSQEGSMQLEESTTSLTSALRSGKKANRSNLSVSFALDTESNMNVSGSGGNKALIESGCKEEKINRFVIADSDDDLSLDEAPHAMISPSEKCNTNSVHHSNSVVSMPLKRPVLELSSTEVTVPKRIRSL
ncbi:MutS protein msh5 [Parelaphostrongylus tenuis]|uniref:MutS protein msh5 n=1 Tax=Parelaphostrongylus tenuis TaxID=148309 RepID=A0AAD5WM91_PARTN|nr:MutS protein msh5 [Parelaphostrongylus tenuis]